MRRLIQLAVLCLFGLGATGAWAVCTGTCAGFTCDVTCSSGSCPPASDTCPGHCLVTPNDTCNGAGDCPGDPIENPCSFDTVMTFGHCSNNPSLACINAGQCGAPGATCGAPFSPYGGDGKAVVCGSGSADTINGTNGNDIICGKGGADTIDGLNGNDTLYGDQGDDTIYGGGGTDSIFGGDGNDFLVATSPTFGAWGNDFIDGGDGNDTIYGSGRAYLFGQPFEGDNVLIGGKGLDYISSNSGRDVIKAGDDNDSAGTILTYGPAFIDDVVGTLICGGLGDDYLVGFGASHQCMDGGDGTDQCYYQYFVSGGTQKPTDLGTGKSCETSSGLTASRAGVSCGCEPG